MTTESNNTTHDLTSEKLSLKQKTAIDLLLQGLSDREVAEKIGARRETVNVWRNHNESFIAELEKARKEMFGSKAQEVEEEIEKVRSTELLSLEGVRARLHLKDSLILQDLGSYNEKRTKLIQRLEADIEQAKSYLETVTSDDIVNDQTLLYKHEVLSKLSRILDETVGKEKKKIILLKLGEEIKEIERTED